MTPRLYFFAHDNRIKIGISRDVERRLKDVGAHLVTPPTCLGFIEGGRGLERHVHGLLAEHRIQGEWFSDCVAVRALVNRLLSDGAAAVNFKESPPIKAPPPIMRERTDEEMRQGDYRLCELMWPEDPIGGLAGELDVDRSQAEAWMTGAEKWPRVTRLAFGALVVIYATPLRSRAA